MADASAIIDKAQSFFDEHKFIVFGVIGVAAFVVIRMKMAGASSANLQSAYAQGAQDVGSQQASASAPVSDPTLQYFNDLLAYQTGALNIWKDQQNYLLGIGSPITSTGGGNSGSGTVVPPAAQTPPSPTVNNTNFVAQSHTAAVRNPVVRKIGGATVPGLY